MRLILEKFGRTATLLVLLGVVGCGSDAPEPAPVASAPTITKAKAERIVKAAALRAADVPGYRRQADGDDEDEAGTCLREGGPFLAEGETAFTKGGLTVGSETDVAASLDVVKADVAYVTGAGFLDCFERYLTASFAEQDLTVTEWAARKVSVRVAKADATFGYSMRFTLRATKGRRAPARLLMFGAAAGHAELTAIALATGTPAPAEAVVTRWLNRLVQRARSAGA